MLINLIVIIPKNLAKNAAISNFKHSKYIPPGIQPLNFSLCYIIHLIKSIKKNSIVTESVTQQAIVI